MPFHADTTLGRLRSFMANGELYNCLYPHHQPVTLSAFAAPDRITFDDAMQGDYLPLSEGHKFGPAWSTHWVRVDYQVPESWQGQEVHLRWDSSSEACVWADGVPLQGLTGTDVPKPSPQPIRSEYVIGKVAKGSERGSLYVEVACNQLIISTGKDDHVGKLRLAEIAMFDPKAWALLWDFMTVAEAALELSPKSPRGAQALWAANDMLNHLSVKDPSTWQAVRDIASEYFSSKNGDGQHQIHAVGHGHLDTAWYWPLNETKRKCTRTFSTAITNMQAYPEYRFVCSQAQQYAWMKGEHPALYEKICTHVNEGRFIPVGGTWIEPDCNLPSGESLVRQFLVGQRFFKQEFGSYCREFWNPDVFGYSGQLPQIMQGFGLKFFLTQKLSQNQFNDPPHHTFWWEGIDGSRVFTHFPPANTYGGNASVKQLNFNVTNYKDLARSNESIYLFGYGDGGGGPTREMLERLQRVNNVDGLPRVDIRPPFEALSRIEKNAKDLATHVGEMYFENHRGTYTTHGLTKRNNRRAEQLLHDVELLSAVAIPASHKTAVPNKYPADEILGLWKTVLLNQFHDIITGCSITQVHQESNAQMSKVLAKARNLRNQAISQLKLDKGKSLVVINTLCQPRREVIDLPNGTSPAVVTAPAMGYAINSADDHADAPVTLKETSDSFCLENQYVRATILRDGSLGSFIDLTTNREAIAGSANHFVLYDDEPMQYHAWNADLYHLDKRHETAGAVTFKIIEQHPLRCTIAFEHQLSDQSSLSQSISLTAVSGRLTFDTHVQWHESNRFLKVEFPTTLRAPTARYEIQFGSVDRPTHFNTSHDLARFEVCGHRWATLAEPQFGLALLTDCKYGYAVHGSVMRLSLLRSPKQPDPQADMGDHNFSYALLPSKGLGQDASVIHEARRFNAPLLIGQSDATQGALSWFGCSNENVVLDTIKKAEDSDDLILRLYEACGSHATTTIHSAYEIVKTVVCNMLEENDLPISQAPKNELNIQQTQQSLTLSFKPYQIVTLKVRLGQQVQNH